MSYQPTAIPSDTPEGLRAWLANQLRQIANALQSPSVDTLHIIPRGAAPAKYSDGDIVYADGTNWDPGSGAGFYGRESGAWVKL